MTTVFSVGDVVEWQVIDLESEGYKGRITLVGTISKECPDVHGKFAFQVIAANGTPWYLYPSDLTSHDLPTQRHP